jgi:hypothetical protein
MLLYIIIRNNCPLPDVVVTCVFDSCSSISVKHPFWESLLLVRVVFSCTSSCLTGISILLFIHRPAECMFEFGIYFRILEGNKSSPSVWLYHTSPGIASIFDKRMCICFLNPSWGTTVPFYFHLPVSYNAKYYSMVNK